MSAVLSSFEMGRYEGALYDLRMETKPDSSKQAPLTLVLIDQESVQNLGEAPPLSLSTHEKALKQILKHDPRQVVYFTDFDPWIIEQNPEAAKGFVDLAKKSSKVMLATDYDIGGETTPPYPLSRLPYQLSVIHRDGNTFAEDQVTRRAILSVLGESTLPVTIAQQNTSKKASEFRGAFYKSAADAHYTYINYQGSSERESLPFPSFAFHDLLEQPIQPSLIKDRIILIGHATLENSQDYAYTPYGKEPFTHPRVGVQAQIINTLWFDEGIIRAPESLNFGITWIISSLVIFSILMLSPISGVITTFFTMILLSGLAWLLFSYQFIWIDLAHPLFGAFFGYYIFVPYRAIREYQKRWNLQKRNEILLQVEELKSNFMSLMSHDLKTPVAKIEGLADFIKMKGELNVDQSKGVEQILSSTQELDRFISSILDLAKVESRNIKLNIEQRDLNKIVEDVIGRVQFRAKEKNIQIDTELEPLFPTPVDPNLITRVINNLIENAIKYSPENSRVLISTKEGGDSVEISVRDEGPGIPEKEKEHIFSKFYRISCDETMKQKGSGLGLYLVKYFVELHRGSIQVKDAEKKGSTFTVSLPIANHA